MVSGAPVHIVFRFFGELVEFLPPRRRDAGGSALLVALPEHDSVKDAIEAQGVPHTEVELILVNGQSVGFSYQVQNGDRISVYPPFRTLDVGSVSQVRPEPPEPRFVLDTHLGTLDSHLRLLGFDTLYRNDYDDATLARISSEEGRILLTRDRGLLKRSQVTHGYHVWETDPDRQVVEVLHRFHLFDALTPFRRCTRCNTLLETVSKAAITERLEPKTRRYYDEFARCPACDQVYWKGSHFEHLQRLVERWHDAGGALPSAPEALAPS